MCVGFRYTSKERAVGAAVDGYVQHGYFAFGFFLFCPFDVRVYAVDVCEEWCDVVVVNGGDGVNTL